MLDEDSDEEQNSDSLDDVSSDDDERFEPDNNSEFDDDDLDDNDLDEDNLDERSRRYLRQLPGGQVSKEISDSILRYAVPSSLAQFLAPSIRREWKRLVHNHDQPFSKARDSNPSGLLDVKHLFEYIHQAVLTSRLDQIQSLACCRYRYTAPWRTKYSYAHEHPVRMVNAWNVKLLPNPVFAISIVPSHPNTRRRITNNCIS
ncbi:hypothetical protein V8E54_002234 [Elaphomyces granulatus]